MSANLSQYQRRHIERVKNKVAKAITNYKLIEDGDSILVAVSGGKDSLVMLETLAAYKQFGVVNYTIEAIHVNVTDVPYQFDPGFYKEFCDKLDVASHLVEVEADIENREKKAPCFVCSWNRRKSLFTYARTYGFQKIAFGHHLDDAVETLLINMAYHGNIASIPAKLSLFDGMLQIIRPLILLTEKDTLEFAHIRNYPPLKENCPFEDKTKRTTARNLIRDLEKIHPKARFNLFNSMGNIDLDKIP